MEGIARAVRVATLRAVFVAAAVMFVAAGVIAAPVEAAPLLVTLHSAPELMSDFIEVRYDAATQSFSARGFAEEITGGADVLAIKEGSFQISGAISATGEVVAGTLVVTGEIPDLAYGRGTLLSGRLTRVGTGEPGPLELQFETQGGTLASNFGPVVSVILSNSGFTGDFTHDFNSPIAVAGVGW